MVLSKNKIFVVLFLATVLVRGGFHFLTGYTADDALITFRYAENLAGGEGFVYNSGEKVLGTTTPLFTFVLATLLLLKMSPFNAALLISLICSGLTTVTIFRLAQLLRFSAFAIIPAIMFILWPRSIVGDSSGLETSLFSLLTIGAFYFQQRNLRIYGTALATLSAVTRPEGFLLLAILFFYNAVNDRQNLSAYLVVPSLIIIPWLTFSYFYFGSIVPSSIAAKLALYAHLEVPSYWQKLVYLLGWHHPLGWVMFSLAIIGGWWLLHKQNFGKPEILWLAGMLAFFTFSRTQIFFWYVAPIYPVYILITTASLPMLANRFSVSPAKHSVLAAALAMLVAWPLLYMSLKQVEYYKNDTRYLNEVHRAIGEYLYVNAGKNDIVAARYIGNTGYYSRMRILDRDGIVTPAANQYNRRGDYLQFITDFKPTWVVAAPTRVTGKFAHSREFQSQYRLVETFGWDDTVRHNLYKIRN